MKCDDPFWCDCDKDAVLFRPQEIMDKPDDSRALCSDCFNALNESVGINGYQWYEESEWDFKNWKPKE